MNQASSLLCARQIVFIVGLVVVSLAGAPGKAKADPQPLTNAELDRVSARGFSFTGLNFGVQSVPTTVTPVVPTVGINDTDVTNIVFGAAHTVNVNTAVNTCVLAVCEDSGAAIVSNPTTVNEIDVANRVVPVLQNTVSVPVVTQSQIGSNAGLVPGPAMLNAGAKDAAFATRHGISRTAPPLPRGWGIK